MWRHGSVYIARRRHNMFPSPEFECEAHSHSHELSERGSGNCGSPPNIVAEQSAITQCVRLSGEWLAVPSFKFGTKPVLSSWQSQTISWRRKRNKTKTLRLLRNMVVTHPA